MTNIQLFQYSLQFWNIRIKNLFWLFYIFVLLIKHDEYETNFLEYFVLYKYKK